MAPSVFGKAGGQSAVLRAPTTAEETRLAYQALLSCPTFSIHCDAKGAEHAAALRDARAHFPIPAFPGSERVGSVGFTEVKAIATWSYVVRRHEGEGGEGGEGGKNLSILFDAPRFVPPAIEAVVRACSSPSSSSSSSSPDNNTDGPAYMVLSHRDDVGEHERWAKHFPRMKRVVHEREAAAVPSLRSCEVILRGEGPWRLPDGGEDVTLLLTPGHTEGSITLLYAPEAVALTGDHLDAAPPANEFGVVPPPPPEQQDLHVFRDYCWHDIKLQLASVAKLVGRGESHGTPIMRVLPGHGSPARFDSSVEFDAAVGRLLASELEGGEAAAKELLARAREELAREPAPVVPMLEAARAR